LYGGYIIVVTHDVALHSASLLLSFRSRIVEFVVGGFEKNNIMACRIEGKVSVGCPPPDSSRSGEEWKSFQFHFHNCATLSTTKDHFIASPEFSWNGHQWELQVYPGGDSGATEGYVSAFLLHLSEGNITTRFKIKILDKFGNAKKTKNSVKREFRSSKGSNSWGWNDFISRFDILDESQNILDSNGTLTIVVSIEEEPTTVFVPNNPHGKMIKEMFLDETTADVCFEVVNNSSADEKEGKKKKSKSSTSFHTHTFILKMCAPMLAAICGSNDDSGGMVAASITDVKPDIFRHLLWYVYGGSVPKEDLKEHAKDIIDAADKYSIVNLKLEAEAAYVESTEITLDNAIDNLLYADTKNCALLKEAVMNFLADNSTEAAEKISFTDFPAHVVKDLLVAFSRNNKKEASGINVDELTTLCVSALRRKLHKMGLEVDGSREAMIASIKSNS
jgi:speckle-type POZ protein